MKYHWPGNIRELGNFVKRFLIIQDEAAAIQELASPSHLEDTEKAASSPNDLKQLVRGVKDEAETEAISRALEQTNWNRKEAARLLNISYKALLYKIRQYGIEEQAASSARGLRPLA